MGNEKGKIKKWLYRACMLAGFVCATNVVLPPYFEAAEYRKFFDAPAVEILAEHRTEGVSFGGYSSISYFTDGTFDEASRTVRWLNGCVEVAALDVGTDAALEWTGKCRTGYVRFLLENSEGGVFEPLLFEGEHAQGLQEGEYRLYLVGKHFCGKLEFSGDGIQMK